MYQIKKNHLLSSFFISNPQSTKHLLIVMIYNFLIRIQTIDYKNQFSYMTNCLHFKHILLLLAVIALTTQTGTVNFVTLDSYSVNAVTNYTWNIIFNSATSRGSLNLTFPTACVLSNTITAWIGSTQLTHSYNQNVLTVNSSLLSGTVTIVVRNVKNPNSAITTSAFSVVSSIDPQFTYGSIVSYTTGLLQSSTWIFSLCTQQPNSVLTINLITTNVIPSGSSIFEVGYGAWTNHYNKHLLTGVSSLTSQVIINSNASTSVTSTDIDTVSQKITITYSLSADLLGSSNLTFIINGVQSPPTQTTPTSSSFRVATADSSGMRIDQRTSVTIQPTCVLNITTGTFGTTAMQVNSNYPSSMRVLFSQTPIITFQATDTFQVYFNYLTNLVGCSKFNFWRNSTKDTFLSNLNQSTSSYLQYAPTSSNYNTDYHLSITLNLICGSIIIPPSQTPVVITFKFKRNGSQYLELSATMSPTAAAINPTNLIVSLSNYQMATSGVSYTFSILTAHPLSSTPALRIQLSNNVVLSSPNCPVSLSFGTVTAQNCSFNGVTRILTIDFTTLSPVASGTNISVSVSGFTNAFSPLTDTYGIQTYYASSVSTSKVQTNNAAYSVTFTGITNYNAIFAPPSMTVYTNTPNTISLTNNIVIPSGSIIYVQFPTAASNVTLTSSPFSVNGSVMSVTANNNGNNSFTLTTSSDIPVGSAIVISSSILTPSTMNSFTYVVLRISRSGVLYIQSASSMVLNVNSVVSIPVTIAPTISITGATSGYTISLTLNVPHPSDFYVQIDLPSDVTFSSSGASCSGNCSSALSGNATSLVINASNTQPASTGQLITFNLAATFVNPRSVGNAASWVVTTKSISPSNTITTSSAASYISAANLLNVAMRSGDPYYINNTNPVRVTFSFTNNLISGDYILMTINSGVYTEHTTVNCSAIYGTCSKVTGSSPGTLGIKIEPNLTFIINKTLSIVIQGLISGSSIAQNVTVSTFNSSLCMIDSGLMLYQLSCKASTSISILNNCRTCQTNGDCIDCYTTLGFYLNATSCVTSCGQANSYLSYDNNISGICTSCTNNCFTCTSATVCIACLSGYFFLQSNSTCLSTCSAAGYISVTDNFGTLICKPCFGDGACLQCSNNLPGTCSLCISTAVLSNGICSANCSTNSMYASGGICYNCDASCNTCVSAGNGGCILCALNYYNYTNYCVFTCPTDTAPSSNGLCTCDSPCSKCQGSTTYCTACTDITLFVYTGSCVGSCPSASYLSGFTCVPCSTACISCTATTCMSCLSSYYLYNNMCYSDCNQVGQQFDNSGSTCVMCPDGCDTCTRATCFSCLAEYSLSSSTSQCVKTCLLTNSCEISASQVIPLPGFISIFVWTIIVVVIKLVLQKSYVPYSVIIGSSVIEFVLIIAALSNATDLSAVSFRLLVASSAERMTLRGLLGGALAINYISNIVYIILFIKYIKPLISNPRQIDVIANVLVLVFGTVTNYRFALIAFSKMFPKPYIYVQNGSKLTPVHYLAISSIILDIIPLSACIIAVMNQQPLSNLFMLGLDLLLIIVLNIFVTIWFVACKKPDEYFDSDIKKYHIEDHNATNQNIQNTLQNEKNLSKGKMIHTDTINFEEEDFTESKNDDLGSNYKKIDNKLSKNSIKTVKHAESIVKKVSPSHINVSNDEEKVSEDSDFNLEGKSVSINPKNLNVATKDTPQNDVNFEQGLKSKHGGSKSSAKIPTRDMPKLNETLKSEGKSVEDALLSKKKSQTQNFSKQALVNSARKNYNRPEKDIQEVQQQLDFGNQPQQSNNESVFERQKQKPTKPYRAGDKKTVKAKKETKTKSRDQPMKIMKKQQKIGYFDTDAFESNAEEDIESIIKKKVWQSAIKHEKQRETDNEHRQRQSTNSDTGYEQISPSWFNVQNQRIDLSDFGENQSEP